MATTAARAGAAAAGDRFAAVHTHTPHASKIPGQHRSCWGQDLLRPGRYPQLTEDVEADVVVVGGGLAGLATAYRLAKAGKSVVVLESRMVGGGNSGKGLGLVSTWTTDHYYEVEKMAGSETARHVAAAHASAVDWVAGVVREEGIECQLQLGEAVVAAVVAERGGVSGAAASTAGAEEGYGKWKKDKASRELREELAAALRSGLQGGRIEHLPPATATTGPKHCGEGALGTPTHTTAASSTGVGVGVGVRVGPEPLPEEVMLVPGCAALHPVRFLLGLADAVVRQGGRIYEDSRAKGGLVTGPSGGVVKTMHGPVAKAREAVVLATHSPINRNQLWVHDRQLPKGDYTIGLEIPAGSAPRQLHRFLNLAKGSGAQPHSARVTALPSEMLPGPHEGGGGSATSYEANKELLLLRGYLHHHGHDEKQYGDPWGDLERWARRHVPQAGRVLFCWSAADYYPADLMGLYGRDPLDLSSPPVYILTGHGGQEWTSATLGSEVVAGTILEATGVGAGANPAWGAAYRPSRVVPGAAWKYTSELTQYFSTVGVSLLKHVVPRSLEDVRGMVAPRSVEANIKPGEGRVAQHGLLKKALYRDPEGVLHVKSALCTHLGCCVEWNPLEKTFDCPCHGSQYDSCGRCIHAPAVGDLEDLGTRK